MPTVARTWLPRRDIHPPPLPARDHARGMRAPPLRGPRPRDTGNRQRRPVGTPRHGILVTPPAGGEHLGSPVNPVTSRPARRGRVADRSRAFLVRYLST